MSPAESPKPKSVDVTPELHAYLVAHGTPPDALQQELIAETRALGGPASMQVSPEQGAFFTLLARLIGARTAVEVGTFTGYSALCVARGLAEGGRLLCCDVSEEWTAIARRYWDRAGLSDRIELRLGPAIDTLASLPDEPHIDLTFIDADKESYPEYWEALVPRMRPGGVLLVDNVLWSGRVAEADSDDASVRTMRAFNELVAADTRVEAVLLPIADGLTIARRR